MGFPVILQVVGYQNSGKTTVITRLLKRIALQKIRVGVIKHHGHGDSLNFNDAGKDTEQHRNAGAAVTTISSAENTLLSANEPIPLETAIEIYKLLGVDCVLIEGYKTFQYPRVVLCKNNDDTSLIESSSNMVAIISETPINKRNEMPFFLWNDDESWQAFLMEYVHSKVSKKKKV
jgi:molybdopterin-guanine dinucleotide biosynthesis protein B